MNRYILSFGISSIIYLFVIIIFIYNQQNINLSKKQEYNRVKIHFTQEVVNNKPKIIKKPIFKEKIKKKIHKHKIIKKKKKKLKQKKQKIKKKIKQKKQKNKKKLEQKKLKNKNTNNITVKKKNKQQSIMKKVNHIPKNISIKKNKVLDNHNIELKKQKYFKKIKQNVQSNKVYPKKALRRDIQGNIKVSFKVSKNGDLIEINILKGKKVFHKSIKNAIRNSFPINIEKNIFKKDFILTITIKFIINE